MSNEYLTPAGFGQAEFTEKRSRFIGRVWRAESEQEALERLRETREMHRDATHNVYAYCIRENSIMRYSDDGEPQGSSGLPALNVFRALEIVNFCCVVTRYFGGTLLGTGGLARAYSRAASMALEAAGISTVCLWQTMLISCPYAMYERVKRELDQLEAVTLSTDFGADVTVEAMLKKGRGELLNDFLREASAGSIEALMISEDYTDVKQK